MPLFFARIAHVLLTVFSALITTYLGRILAAFGFSVITYKGADIVQRNFVSWINTELGRMPSDVLQIFYLAGGGIALNWIFGATAFAFSLSAVTKIGSVFKQK